MCECVITVEKFYTCLFSLFHPTGSHIWSSRMLHSKCVAVACIHSSWTNMSESLRVFARECMHTLNAPCFILLSKSIELTLGNMNSYHHYCSSWSDRPSKNQLRTALLNTGKHCFILESLLNTGKLYLLSHSSLKP